MFERNRALWKKSHACADAERLSIRMEHTIVPRKNNSIHSLKKKIGEVYGRDVYESHRSDPPTLSLCLLSRRTTWNLFWGEYNIIYKKEASNVHLNLSLGGPDYLNVVAARTR
jgi:hypothetical protein